MSSAADRVAEALRVSVKEAERLRRQNQRLLEAAAEPIAIVGMSCRYPGGVSSPEDLWDLLGQERDAITGFPADRGWDLERLYDPEPGDGATSYAREGGFLSDAAEFDPTFFAISPREALSTDPQQRLLLEAAWEALEDAGVDPLSLRGGPTGVFAGVMYSDYGSASDVARPGMTTSAVSGRVAYALGLEGPTMTVDTACSSSLVAMHLAAGALRAGECELALAGGVTVLSTPGIFIEFSRQRALSLDGRCKAFAEAADGTGLSEGVGVLALERLSVAEARGHNVLATIRGSAVNQDGASNGLTAPNGPSQERVIRQALANARLEPKDIDAVEAHGTGTTLGDPIEAGALLATYGQEREKPLKLGSVKSNIGHTQAAAGVAGVIKTVMAMREGVLPKTLHVDAPSSKVDWEAGEIELLTEATEWKPNGHPRRAGVSSFGASGTNAHLILEEGPALGRDPGPGPSAKDRDEEGEGAEASREIQGPIPFALSAKSEPALREAASRLAAYMEDNPDLEPLDVAHSLIETRAQLDRRAVAVGSDREELLIALTALAQDRPSPDTATAKATSGRLAYLLTGQGSQRAGMGRELYETYPAYAEALDEACVEIDKHLDKPLKELIFAKRGSKKAKLLDDTTYAQPALFATELALHRLFESFGLKPDLLTGHSVGEIVAAHISGVFSLEDAAKLIAARGKLMGDLPEGGAMLAVEATEQETLEAIEGKEDSLSLAAVNGPKACVISGAEQAIAVEEAHWQEQGRKTKRLTVSHAFHSPLIEPMLEPFAEVVSSLELSEPQLPVVSNTTGEQLTPEQATDPAYWVSHARQPVRFADAVATLKDQGATAYLELGPDPVLTAMAAGTLSDESAALIPALREGKDEAKAVALALGSAHAAGAKVDWPTFFRGTAAKTVPLPTYPFQRKRYWLDPASGSSDPSAIGQSDAEHPLLSAKVEDPRTGGLILTGRISTQSHPWLADHAVAGTILLPGTAFLELALRAGQEVGVELLEELTMQAPLILPEQGAVALQVKLGGEGERGEREVSIYSRADSAPDGEETQWALHAQGTLLSESPSPGGPLAQWPPIGAEPLETDSLYERLADAGLDYGPAFQGLTAAWRSGGEIYAEVSLAEEQAPEAARFAIHPALLDSALHGALLGEMGEVGSPKLPFAWAGVSLRGGGASELRVRIGSLGEEEVSLAFFDRDGRELGRIGSLRLRRVEQGQLGEQAGARNGLLAVEWQEQVEELPVGDDTAVQAIELAELDFERFDDASATARAACTSALARVQEWLAAAESEARRLAILTSGAVAAQPGEGADPVGASVWGLLRSAQAEHPGRFALIDSDGSDASREALEGALVLGAEEPQLALREGRLLVPRVVGVAAPGADEDGEPPRFDPDATVLISGATGGLGSLFAEHLVEAHGARRLLLVSRKGAEAEGAGEIVARLEQLGASVRIEACDVSSRSDLEALIESIDAEHPLGAVIHAAGIVDDGLVTAMGEAQLDRAFAPKLDGAWHLHELTADRDLSAFVLFSSLAGTLSTPAQANYAAANAFLDALAAQRRESGRPASSMAWGLWDREAGMSARLDPAAVARMTRAGLAPLGEGQGLALFDAALGAGRPHLLTARLDRARLRGLASQGALDPMLRGLAPAPARRRGAGGLLGERLASLPEAEQLEVVLDLVRTHAAAVLGHGTAAEVDPERAFRELGFDSLAAVELRNRLGVEIGLQLPATVVFDYPNAASLAAHLLGEAGGEAGGRAAAPIRAVASEEPIAIVGMSCRYPGGVRSPAGLWALVEGEGDAIGEFPDDRGWDLERLYDPDPDSPGTAYARAGGFVYGAAEFDPAFFSISPQDALDTDPQQRLLLEACWEACEETGLDPGLLRGSRTGVFAGAMYHDYGWGQGASARGYGGTVGTGSLLSGRVAYALGLEGPTMTVDTACSSSLVAMHLAVQALRAGECELALAGGVTVLATPRGFIEFSRQRGLSPDGRCKSFSEAADGVGFAEGVGVLVLERLSVAEAKGHRVLATIRGSAVNQDGASNGLTAPNGPSQERVIRQALANARLQPSDIDAVEAHGTGTTLGDPIEAGALLATYGQERERPLKLGSVKSNIGHTQAAAGVAGVIKTVMAMREGVLPKTLHVDAPSSKVDWAAGEIELLTEATEWESNGHPRRAGVSSFGASGTNAHLILEEGPAPAAGDPSEAEGALPFVLSAKTGEALCEAASRLVERVSSDPELGLADLSFSLATTRSAFERRAVLVGGDRQELLSGLSALAQGKEADNLLLGAARPERRPVFCFPGQGSQHAGMALELLDSSVRFASHMRECEEALSPFVEWSLQEILRDTEGAWLDRLDVVQPALFAVMVSLARLWRECGVEPAVVLGHSQGEIAAAHIAGGLTLQDAARVVALRAKAMTGIAGKGAMLSVAIPEAELSPLIEPYGERVSLAALNGPASLVLSGEPGALEELLAECEEKGIRARSVAVDYAAHSAQIDALKDELLEAFAPISPQSGHIPFHSTVAGELTDTAELGPEYWYRNLRETVRFEPALRSLLQQGHRTLIEIAPHPVLGFAIEETVEDALADPEEAAVLGTLRREEQSERRFALSLAAAHASGAKLDWSAFFAGTGAKAVPLPTYPFQRKRYWLSPASGSGDLSAAGQAAAGHPLLSAIVEDPEGGIALTGRISTQSHPWLADHAVAGTVLLPGTAFVELALRAGREVGCELLEELVLQAPLILPERGALALRVSLSPEGDGGEREVSVHSRAEAGPDEELGEWVLHAQGTLSAAAPELGEPLAQWPPAGVEPLEAETLYERLADLGLDYGPAFQGLTAAWKLGEEVYAEVSLAEGQEADAARFGVHPALLDSALHGGLELMGGPAAEPGSGGMMLPFAWTGITVASPGRSSLRVRLGMEDGSLVLAAFDEANAPVLSVASVIGRAISPEQLGGQRPRRKDLLSLRWEEVSPVATESIPARLVRLPELGPERETDTARAAHAATRAALELIQATLAEETGEGEEPTRLALLTEGAVGARPGEDPDPAAAAVWGLWRSAASENPGRFALIDSDGSDASQQAIEKALTASAAESQLALREGELLAPRVSDEPGPGAGLVPPEGPWRLDAPKRGSLEDLELAVNPAAEEPLPEGTVRLAVRAAGVNFRDVVVALGFDVTGGAMLGGEGAGIVTEIGPEVEGLAIGDRVMGMVPWAFAPTAVAAARGLVKIPAGWSFEQAASVPAVYCTAGYGLFDLAGLKAGEKVLIHAGAGGVGSAAIALAHRIGAEVFATASPSKWDVLRAAGVAEDRIASSRDLDFEQRFLETTDGKGVDVVLNSLAGEYVDASLALLPNGGRFLEMGKTDIRDPEAVAASHPGVAYRAYDLGEAGIERIGEMLGELSERLQSGELPFPALTTWDVRRAPEAFRHLREGKNVGKVVLEIPTTIDPERTVLISGATGTIGSLVARHLVEAHGARHLLLAGRSGPAAEGAPELAEELERLGAQVRIEACDFSSREQAEALIGSIDPERPLGAIVHAAGVLEDGVAAALSAEQLERVLAPKVDGAWNLHELSQEMDLSAFLMFSSMAGTVGGPGQGNYAAANVFMDALAQHRQARGLAATSIAWGMWESASAMTGDLDEQDKARARRFGAEEITDERGMELFDAVLGRLDPLVIAAPVDRGAFARMDAAGMLPPILSGLLPRRSERRRAPGASLAERLARVPAAEREAAVLELVREEAAAVLGHSSAREVAPDRPFSELGFDSLATVELRNRLGEATGMRLAATLVFDYPSAAELAAHLLERASGASSAPQAVLRAQGSDEPIAIVGIACRYPGAVNSPEQLWGLVAEGRDAIGEFPTDRGWDIERLYHPDPDHPGTSHTREGGFVYDAADFDPAFFGISPREAMTIDPQQRLLLEASWEAFEHAGIDPIALRGTQTGIFAGVSSLDYSAGLVGAGEEYDGHRLIGMTASVVSGRVSYTLGLEGPAMSIDTACSSSLVAIHLAAQALRGGECSLALAGGVTVIATPTAFAEFSRQRGLAPDGRCKPFAEAADGTGWSEGVGVLALERLSDAEANGHRVLATVLGSAVNQDGASNGLTAPNGPSQERVIRQALANAGLQPADVDAVEAHGTGTMLGDPIEAGALLATYGQEREAPLRLGSIKSNIGHSQAAAGVGGVIKTVMAMREGVLPKTLHLDSPSSKVDWDTGKIELLSEASEWKPNGRPRRAGVSSFGVSGTNAHVILEEAPRVAVPDGRREEIPGPLPLLLSAKSEGALREAAARLAAHLRERPELELTDVAYSLATTRAQLEMRAVVVGEERREVLEALDALANGEPSPDAHEASARQGRLAYLLTGQGSQRAGMGSELYETYPAYAEALDEACEEIDKHLDRPLKELIFSEPGSEAAELLDDTTYAQPALFATELALHRLFESFGLKPDLLTGHSVGEIVAAHISGVFSLEDGAKLIAARGKLMGDLPEGGAMLAVEATEQETLEAIEGKQDSLSLAAVNGPRACVISGAVKEIEAQEAHFQEQGRKTKRLVVSHAFHSPLIEPMLAEFGEVVASLALAEPKLPVISNFTGKALAPEQATDPAYWVSHARQPVRFADAVATLKEQGATAYLELGPDPVLTAMAAGTLAEDEGAALIPTLREGRDGAKAVALALGSAHASGAKVDWAKFFEGTGAKAVPLPTYPFQRKRYWLSASATSGDPAAIGQAGAGHPLLGATIEDPEGGVALTGRISAQTHPWLSDHVAGGVALLPGTAFVELALRAGQEAGCEHLEELVLQAPLPIPEAGGVALRVSLSPEGDRGERQVSIHSRAEAGPSEGPGEWVLHAQGVLSAEEPEPSEPLEAWPPEGAESLAVDDAYERLAVVGFDYGPAFQGLTAAWKLGGEVYAEVSLAEEQEGEAARFRIHPALLDSALHGGLELLASSGGEGEGEAGSGAGGIVLPFAWTGVQVQAPGRSSLRVRLAMEGSSFALTAFDEANAPVLDVASMIGRPVSTEQLGDQRPQGKDLFSLAWVQAPQAPSQGALAKLLSLSELGPEREADTASAAHEATKAALELIQATLAEETGEGEEPTRLALLTEGAVAARPDEDPDPAAAAVWGLLRSASSENPGRFALIDSDGSDASQQAIAKALALSGAEPQLALREGELLAPRVSESAGPDAGLVPPEGPWRLEAPKRGTLEALELVASPVAEEALPEGTVRLAMRAAGVNFRDVMSVLGVYPGQTEIGGEGAGIVTEIGPGVEGFAVGDRVMGMFPAAFAPTAIADARALVEIPEGWSFELAASVPAAFCTARYGLSDLAGLKAGESVLVHAGAGAVGSAAVAIARSLGAEVFATASPSKWDALRAAGVAEDHIASSRDLSFKERFLEATEGRGVDVVLNSLAGEYVDASLALLPGGGRFLEMGKADIRDPEQVAASHPGVAYRAYDLGEAGSERFAELLGEATAQLARDELALPTHRGWDIRRAPEAFRHLREGKNVGKVVLEIPAAIDPERTVLITGATGTIGSLVARHLVEAHGARHLLLTSRSGMQAKGAKELAGELAELGASVRIEACDVSSRQQLEALLASVDSEHPLGAVIHAAGTIEDGISSSLAAEQLERVLAPKVDGAWNLHELTREMGLTAFVTFSSMAGTVGAPGQGNYAAANVFMDALAQQRRANGLAATSIAWGRWASESAITGELNEQDKARAKRVGAEEMTNERGLELFDAALARLDPLVLATPVDRAALVRMDGAGMLPPILRSLLPKRSARRQAPTVTLAERLARVPEAEREATVLELVREEVAAVLGYASAKEVPPERSFGELGFDSLAAVEMRNRLGTLTEAQMPITLIFDYSSAAALAGFLLAEFNDENSEEVPDDDG